MTRISFEEDQDFSQVSDQELSDLLATATAEWQTEIDLAFEEATVPQRIERGTGYCENPHCEDCYKGRYLWLHEGDFFCPICQKKGQAIGERGIPERKGAVPFAAVRIEFNYDPSSKRYKGLAVVQDESWLGKYGTYTLQTPLVHTEQRALKLAEIYLCVLNQGVYLNEDLSTPPRSHEKLLDLSKSREDFFRDLKLIEQNIRDNEFLTGGVVSPSSEGGSPLREGEESGSQPLPHRGTTDARPRVFSRGDAGRGALHLHDRYQPSGSGSERSESRLHPLQPLGTHGTSLRGESSQGRRGGDYREDSSQLRTTAGGWLSSLLRGARRTGAPGTQELEEPAAEARRDSCHPGSGNAAE